MSNPQPPKMPLWQIILLVIFGSCLAIIMLHAGLTLVNAFNSGRVTVSPTTQNTIVLMLLGIATVATQFVTAWFQKRTSDLNRQQNQAALHDAKEEIKDTMKNGGGDAIASKTATAIAPLILGEERRTEGPPDTGERRRGTDRRRVVTDEEDRDARR